MHLHIDCSHGLSVNGLLGACCALGADVERLVPAMRSLPLVGLREVGLRVSPHPEPEGHGCSVSPTGSDPSWAEETVESVVHAAEGSTAAPYDLQPALAAIANAAYAAAIRSAADPQHLPLGQVADPAEWVCSLALAAAFQELRITSATHSPIPVPVALWGERDLDPPWLDTLVGRTVVGSATPGLRITPLGIAWLDVLHAECRPFFPMELSGTGLGLCADDSAVHVLYGVPCNRSLRSSELWVLEANLDDLSPEITGTLIDTCLEAGARDAWLTPVLMKKGRPAQMFSVLVDAETRTLVESTIFSHSSTLGIRAHSVHRNELERSVRTVKTPWGPVRVKEGRMDGRIVNQAPEYEDCRRLAAASGVPLKRIYAAAVAALGDDAASPTD